MFPHPFGSLPDAFPQELSLAAARTARHQWQASFHHLCTAHFCGAGLWGKHVPRSQPPWRVFFPLGRCRTEQSCSSAVTLPVGRLPQGQVRPYFTIHAVKMIKSKDQKGKTNDETSFSEWKMEKTLNTTQHQQAATSISSEVRSVLVPMSLQRKLLAPDIRQQANQFLPRKPSSDGPEHSSPTGTRLNKEKI